MIGAANRAHRRLGSLRRFALQKMVVDEFGVKISVSDSANAINPESWSATFALVSAASQNSIKKSLIISPPHAVAVVPFPFHPKAHRAHVAPLQTLLCSPSANPIAHQMLASVCIQSRRPHLALPHSR